MKSLLVLAAVLHLGLLQEVPEPFQVPDICTETGPDQGTCGDYNVRWFFNPEDGLCKEFMYSGCGGNKNNFNSQEDCNKMCIGQGSTQDSQQKESTSGEDHQVAADTLASEAVPAETGKTDKEVTEQSQAPESQETAQVGEKAEEEEDDEDGLNDGEEDDDLLNKYLRTNGQMSPEDNEMLKEAMAAYEVSAMKPVVDSEEEADPVEDGTEPRVQEAQTNPTEENINLQTQANEQHRDDQMTNDKSSERILAEREADEEEEDEFIEDNGKEIDSFLDHIGAAASAEDREMILEGIAELGAVTLKRVDELDDGMETEPFTGEEPIQTDTNADVSEEIKEANDEIIEAKTEINEAKSVIDNIQAVINPVEPTHSEAKDDEDDDEDDDTPDGIDLDVEYPALHGMLSAEDQQILTEAMNAYGVVEAVTDGRKITEEIVAQLPTTFEELKEMQQTLREASVPKQVTEDKSETQKPDAVVEKTIEERFGFVDMNDSAGDSDEDAAEEDPVDEIMHHEKDAIFNPGKINPEDRFMLSELVSQFDVAVMEEKEIEEEKGLPNHESKLEEDKRQYNPEENRLASPAGDGLLPPRCTMPAETGPCRARKLKWFFDMETGKCSTFIYGGCQGNANRFRSRGKCMDSCLGLRRQPYNKPNGSPDSHKTAPTRSPTQKITFMMPFVNDRAANKPNFPPMPIRQEVPPPSLSIKNIRERVSAAFTKLSQGLGRPQEPILPVIEPKIDDFRSPFSPLRFMLLRALTKPRVIQGKFARPPKPTPPPPRLPFGPRIRIMLPRPRPAQVPMLHTQQSIPNLLQIRSVPTSARSMKMPMRNRFPSFDINGYFNQVEQEPDNGHSVFTPRIKTTKKIQSANHDNRHLNNVSPNNKFTLLQVFVNKPHGAQSPPVNPIQRPRQAQRAPMPLKKPLPPPPPPPMIQPKPYHNHMMNQAAKNFPPPYPMYYPMMMPHHTHPAPFMHSHLPPHHHHDNPFHGPYNPSSRFMPNPFSGPSRPFNPPRPSYDDIRDEARRPMMPQRPVVIETNHEQEDDEERSRYACLLPLAPGHCKSYQTKWYYNRDSNKCEIFYFTGCGGNGNKFETWEQCAATCIDMHEEPKTTTSARGTEEPSTTEQEEKEDKRPDTIIITSTVFPKTEAEAKQAAEEAQAGAQDPPSIDELMTTPETPVVEAKQEPKEEARHSEDVISKASHISTEYMILLVVMAVVALAVVVILTLSIVHICRRSSVSKKEKALDAVINQQLNGDLPKVVYTVTQALEPVEKS